MPIPAGTSADQLVQPADLVDFPGGPFADTVVAAAAESVRADAGWRIAPQLTETLTVDSVGGRLLILPTMHLVEVTAIRDVTGDTPVDVTGWTNRATLRFRSGVLERSAGWPRGVLEVDVTHGYPICPTDLLPAIAFRCQQAKVDRSTGSVRLGSLSVNPGGPSVAEGAQPDAVVAKYTIPPRA